MSETHSLAVRIEHHDSAAYMALALDVRHAVELELLDQVAQLIPKSVQEQWLDPDNLSIQPTTVNGVTSFTLSAIDALFAEVLSEIGQQFTLSAAVRTNCRHCQPYHCDRVCRDLLVDGAPWVVATEAIPGDASSLVSASVALEFEFPSPN